MPKQAEYNGWKNYETWNVALWIANDEPLYRQAVAFANRFGTEPHPYSRMLHCYAMNGTSTPDGVRYDSDKVSRVEMDAMIRELADDGMVQALEAVREAVKIDRANNKADTENGIDDDPGHWDANQSSF
jgi:hypothetical protein